MKWSKSMFAEENVVFTGVMAFIGMCAIWAGWFIIALILAMSLK